MEWLGNVYEECVRSETTSVAVLQSPTGWGKTFEVLQWYEGLASDQRGGEFWPPEVQSSSRKVTFPSPIKPRVGSRLTYLWLGLCAGWDGSALRFAGFDLRGQLVQLIEPLAAAANADASRRHDLARTVLRAVTSTAAVSVLPVGEYVREIKHLSEIIRELLELVPDLLEQSHGKGASTQKALMASGGRTLVTDNSDADRKYAEDAGRLLATVSQIVPMIVVIEDAQFLDDHTTSMLRACTRPRDSAGLLVVLTVATDRPGPDSDFARWVTELKRAGRLVVKDLPALDDDAIASIAMDWLSEEMPGVPIDAAVLAELALECDGNPLTLSDLLDREEVRNCLAKADSGPLRAALTSPPSHMAGLASAFERLPLRARQVLAVAAEIGFATTRTWLFAAFRVIGMLAGQQEEALAAAIDSGWLRPGSDGLIGFVDAANQRAAVASRTLSADELAEVQRAVTTAVMVTRDAGMWREVPLEARQGALQVATATTDDANLCASFLIELDELYAATGQHQRRLELLENLREMQGHVNKDIDDKLVLTLASGYLELRRNSEALSVLRCNLEMLRASGNRSHGPTGEATLVAEHNLASALSAAGDITDSVEAFVELLAHRLSVLPPHHRHIRDTRRELAANYSKLGRDAEARDVAVDLHEDNIVVLGAQHPVTLADAVLLFRSVRRAGDPAAAAAALERIVETMTSLFVLHDHRTFLARLEYAQAVGDAGDPPAAVRALQLLLKEEALILAEDDPRILTARSDLALMHAECGDTVDALKEYEHVLAERSRVLGLDHEDTLSTRNQIGSLRGQESGGAADAVAAFDELVSDALRWLVPDHHTTLSARANLAYWRAEAGDLPGATAGFEAVLRDRQRVNGPEHPLTFVVHNNLASILRRSGHFPEAVAAFQQLLSDRRRVLGEDHPDTLLTRANLVTALAQAGDRLNAAAASERLVADSVRVLGSKHPQTLNARGEFGCLLGEIGNPGGAATTLNQLKKEVLEVLGPDHPSTLLVRQNLATWRARAGNPAGALRALEQLVADRSRVLGPDHLDTLFTRNSLAECRGIVGDRRGAARDFKQLLTDQMRLLGPDHAATLRTRDILASRPKTL